MICKRIIYVDECIFSYQSIHDKAYSTKGQNCTLPPLKQTGPALHLVAGISNENGLEGYAIFEHSVNSDKFLLTVDKFFQHGEKFTLFGDNPSWHTSRQVFNILQQKRLYFIKNVPYSPMLNPIEKVFSAIKNDFGRSRINAIENGYDFSPH